MANTRTITKIYRSEVTSGSDGLRMKLFGFNTKGRQMAVTVNLPYAYQFQAMMEQIKRSWVQERERRIRFINETDNFTLKP